MHEKNWFGRVWESEAGGKAFIPKRYRADGVLLWKSSLMVLGWFPGKGMVGRWNSVYTRTYITKKDVIEEDLIFVLRWHGGKRTSDHLACFKCFRCTSN